MRTIILDEHGQRLFGQLIIQESYSDKVNIVKRFLDGNFMKASAVTDNDDGTKGNMMVFIKLSNGIPTDSSCTNDDVFDIIQNKFVNILGDEKERDGFLRQVINDWANNKISKYGSLSNYMW